MDAEKYRITASDQAASLELRSIAFCTTIRAAIHETRRGGIPESEERRLEDFLAPVLALTIEVCYLQIVHFLDGNVGT